MTEAERREAIGDDETPACSSCGNAVRAVTCARCAVGIAQSSEERWRQRLSDARHAAVLEAVGLCDALEVLNAELDKPPRAPGQGTSTRAARIRVEAVLSRVRRALAVADWAAAAAPKGQPDAAQFAPFTHANGVTT